MPILCEQFFHNGNLWEHLGKTYGKRWKQRKTSENLWQRKESIGKHRKTVGKHRKTVVKHRITLENRAGQREKLYTLHQFVNNTITQTIFSSSNDEAVLEKSASVKMIDFAHVWPAEVVLVIGAVDDGVKWWWWWWRSGLHKLWNPAILDGRTWNKFGEREHGEHGKDGKHQPDDLNTRFMI